MLSVSPTVLIALLLPFQAAQSGDPPQQKESASAEYQPDTTLRRAEEWMAIVKATDGAQRQEEPASQTSTGQKEPGDNWNLGDKIALIATAVGFLQFLALIATVWVMRNSAQRQLRAYVLVSAGKVSNFEAGQIPEVEIVIRNSGQTPAYKAVSWVGANADFYPSKVMLSPPDSAIPMPAAAIPAGDIHQFFVPLRRALSDCEVADINCGLAAIFAWGEIRYFDVFKRPRCTKFAMFYGGPAGARPSGALTFAMEGNDAD